MIWMPTFGSPSPQPAASVRVVTARRRSAVALSLRAPEPAEPAVERMSIEICVESRPVARYAVDAETASALACLLDGPVWLLMVAADVPGCLFGRLWALVPVAVEAPLVLGDEDGVYALPLAEVRIADAERVHPGNLIAEVSHLLHHLPPGSAATD